MNRQEEEWMYIMYSVDQFIHVIALKCFVCIL